MNKTIIITVIVIIILVGGYFAWNYSQPLGSNYTYKPTEPGATTPPAGYVNLPAPTPVTQPQPVVTPPSAQQSKTWQINCKNGAYVPSVINIKKGDTVKWTNVSCNQTWPASAVHPTHGVYPQNTGACPTIGGSDFDACRGLKVGESWSLRFDYVGSWKFHDHLFPKNYGTVNVAE